ncbi:hypothetical protein N0V86_005118 [Didymella sp. IMI 355093]|nr:hypothetical protein N0V86_005118 [Didymella sp. IMI 355093]
MPVKRGPDGGKLHLSNQGVDPTQDSSESQEELPPPPPPKAGLIFANLLSGIRTGTRNAQSTTEVRRQVTPASHDHPEPASTAQTVIRNHTSEVNPAAGGEADRIREARTRTSAGYLRAAVDICKTGHIVLVIQWSTFDPVNRKGTWSLEVFDSRRSTWEDNLGVEAHEQCISLSSADKIMRELAYSMVERWKEAVPERSCSTVWEPNCGKRNVLGKRVDEKLLPSLVSIQRELRPLVVYAMGGLPRSQSEQDNSGKDDKSNEDGKGDGDDNRQKLVGEHSKEKRKAARDKARLAHLAGIMDHQKHRHAKSKENVERAKERSRLAQRETNGAEGVYDNVSRNFVPKVSVRSAAGLELKKIESKKKNRSKKSGKTEEEDADLRRIRAAARKDRERQEQEVQEQELVARQVEVKLVDTQEESSDVGLSAAIEAALDNASPEPDMPKPKPTKILQKTETASKSTTKASDDELQPRERRRRLHPRAPVTPVTRESSDSDSVKPPQPDTPTESKPKAKPKTRPSVRKLRVPSAGRPAARSVIQGGASELGTPKEISEANEEVETSEKSKTKETKTAKAKKTKTMKSKWSKTRKSEEFIADNDLENDTTGDVSLPSDKLQNEEFSVETTETTTAAVHSKHGDDVVEEIVETNIIAVEVQQRDGSVERTEITETTTARSDSSEYGETTVKHTTHVETVTHPTAPDQEMLCNSPPPLEQGPKDGFNTPTNALGISMVVTPPPASPPPLEVSSAHMKRKSATPDEEPEGDQKTETARQEDLDASSASPSPRKKRKTTSPISAPAENVPFPDETASSESLNTSAVPIPDDAAATHATIPPTPAKNGAPAVTGNAHSPGPAPANSPPFPAELVTSSISSSSSKKRKTTASEDDGRVSISPGGTKRVKRVQSSGVAAGEETGVSELVQEGIVAGLDGMEKVDVDDDQESYDSLFDGSLPPGDWGSV